MKNKKDYKIGDELKRVMIDESSFDSILEKDLNEGDDGSWKDDDHIPDSLENIKNTIKHLNCPPVDIITSRGTLSKIMLMPYIKNPF